MSMDPELALARVPKSVQFKEYLLNRDVSSRRVILETCIRFMKRTTDDDRKKAQAIAWLQNLLDINVIMSSEERKNQIRFDACWDELHTDLVGCEKFYQAMCRVIQVHPY